MTILETVRHEMARQGYNAASLARKAGISENTMHMWLQGRRTRGITCSVLEKIMDALGLVLCVGQEGSQLRRGKTGTTGPRSTGENM